MITTEAHFEKIRSVIKTELLSASHSVYAAIAWFTDPILFDALLAIAEKGVKVQVCIIRDEINMGSGLAFEKLKTLSGNYFYAPDDRMHHKFCVIDNETVITGSFNWTVRASMGQKKENIVVTKGDAFLANQFVKEFNAITRQTTSDTATDIAILLKRCKVINGLILLNDDEDIQKHAEKLLQDGEGIQEVEEIVKALQQKNFDAATLKIELLIKKYSTVQVFKDPQEDNLLFEIKLLEYQIIAVQDKKAEAEKIVFEYDRMYNTVLGEVVKEYLLLKKKLTKIIAEKEPENTEYKSKYEEADADYAQYDRAYETSKKKAEKANTLSDEDKKALKRIYREASMLCHPDKYQNAPAEVQRKAEDLFKQLNDANQLEDIDTVKTILENLKTGVLDKLGAGGAEKTTIAKLKTTLAGLMAKYDALVAQYETVVGSSAYKTTTEQLDLTGYFENSKQDIEAEIKNLKTQLNRYEYAE
jgi:hypothetical protein